MRRTPPKPARARGPFGPAAEGFTLIETLAVIGIILLITGFTVPAVRSLGNSNNLNTAARLIGNLLTVARSQAINGNSHVQVRVVTDQWLTAGRDDATAHYRQISLWQRGSSQTTFSQIAPWQTLPAGITLDSSADPGTKAAYHFSTTDPPGTYVLAASLANTLAGVATGPSTADVAYLEFAPDGAVYFNASVTTLPSQVYLLLVDANKLGGGAPNWAQIRAASLTGRISVVRP